MVKGYSEQSITAELVKAKNAYYKTGTSHLTDHEYDALEGSLRALCPEAEILQKVGTVEEE
jgi:NAD-dependent DNA ligase